MKILHIVHQYWPYLCGSGKYFQEISERFQNDGHEVTVYTSNAWDIEHFWSKNKKTIEKGYEIHNGVIIRRFKARHLPYHPRMSRFLHDVLPWCCSKLIFSYGILPGLLLEGFEKHDFDIVHAGLVPHGNFLYTAYRIAKKNQIPLVTTPFVHIGEPSDTQIKDNYTEKCQMDLIKRSNIIFVQTSLEKNELINNHGFVDINVKILGMGINPEEVTGGDSEIFRVKYKVKNKIISYIGTKTYDKGTQHIIESMKLLWFKGWDFTLVIAGPPIKDFLEYMEQQSNSVKRNILNLDYIDGKEKKDLLAATDIFLMPSRSDSFGIVYLEAWINEKPVIGAFAGGVPEVISNGYDGFLVPFGNIYMLAGYTAKLLNDENMCRKMGERGKEKVLKFHTWEQKYRVIKETYELLSNESV